MKSYKCLQCGFVSSITTQKCKICGAPNVNHPTFATVTNAQFEPTLLTVAQPVPTADWHSLAASEPEVKTVSEPKEAITSEDLLELPSLPATSTAPAISPSVTSESQSKSVNKPISHAAQSRSATFYFAPYSPEAFELETAEKNIRLAWQAGRVWCILICAVIVLMVLAFLADSSESAASISPFPFLIMALLLAVGASLTYGVYKKNKACAVALVCLTGSSAVLNLLDYLATRDASGIARLLLAGVFCYFFSLGVRGIFKYHKLTNG